MVHNGLFSGSRLSLLQEKKINWTFKGIIALARKIATIMWYFVINDEMYEDETGCGKGEIQRERLLRLRYSRLITD
jgi:hypothetical protein